MEKSGKMDQKQGIPLQCEGEVGNSRPEFWQIPLVSIFRHSITVLLHYERIYPKK